jgi:hypothetical protein
MAYIPLFFVQAPEMCIGVRLGAPAMRMGSLAARPFRSVPFERSNFRSIRFRFVRFRDFPFNSSANFGI